MILQTKRVRICLDPSPRVAIVNNIANYNRLKFRLFTDKLKHHEETNATMPSIFYNSLNHMANKLEKSNTPRPPHIKQKETHSLLNLVNKRGITVSNSDGEITGINTAGDPKKVEILPIPDIEIPYDIATFVTIQKTELRFSRQNEKFLTFHVEKAEGMGYNALLRFSSDKDYGTNASITRFCIRDAESVTKFINQLVNTSKKEGYAPISEPERKPRTPNPPNIPQIPSTK